MSADALASSIPTRLGRYELLLPIGSGGMASVYLARAAGPHGFERDVAIKIIHPHLREHVEMSHDLLEEAKLAARIRHPNVISVLEADRDEASGLVYLVMDYIEGDTLSYVLRQARSVSTKLLAPPIALKLMADALAGLHAAHELTSPTGDPLHVVHRDFSPQNILVGLDGVARLTDFGIAKAHGRAALTQTGFVKGKVCYMSPEQARGDELDRRSDVWAAGVVLWELLAGRPLFDHRDEMKIVMQLISEDPLPRLRTIRPEIPAALDDAVAAALTRDRGARLASAKELRDAVVTGWKRPADASEVAASIDALIGARVTERRSRAEEIRRERTSLSSGAPVVSATPAVSSTKTSKPPRTAIAVGIGVAALAVLGISLASVTLRSKGADAHVTTTPPIDSAPLPPETASSASIPAPTPTPSASAPPSTEVLAADRIAIEADAPMVAVAVGGKNIAMADPSERVEAIVDPAQQGATLKIVAKTKDGRRVEGRGRAGTLVRLSFPALPDARPGSAKGGIPRPSAKPSTTPNATAAPAGPQLIVKPYER